MAVTNGQIGGLKPSWSEDASGGVALLGPGGTPIPVPAVVNAGTGVTAVPVAAGEHTSVAIATPGYYRIDPDMDVYVKGSDASAIYGAELTADTDMYSTTAGSLAAQTGLEVGLADFAMEFWLQLTADTPNQARPFGWGVSASGIMVQPYLGASAGGVLQVGLQMKDSAGTDFKAATYADITGQAPSTALRHYVINVDRAGNGATGTVTYYLDGAQVAVQTYTEAATAANLSASGITGASARIVVGGTLAGNAEWDGRIEDIKVYTRLLTLAEIQARTNAGPLRNAAVPLDSADLVLTWWLNFQQSGSWANALHPECVSGYGNATFNSLVGSPTITERTGGTAATTSDNKIYGGKPEMVNITNDYLSIYSTALSAGDVRLTRVA